MLILNNAEIGKKLTRMALQIYERNTDIKEIVVAGLSGNGWFLAGKLADELAQLSNLTILRMEVTVEKGNPSEKTTKVHADISKAQGKRVIVVDDVLNTGRTLVYGLSPFISARAASISTAVLADRNHRNFPVSADIVGISLATTVHEHIELSLDSHGTMELHLN